MSEASQPLIGWSKLTILLLTIIIIIIITEVATSDSNSGSNPVKVMG